MMAQDTIGRGAVANDGTGDPARTFCGKINDNFAELYELYGSIGLTGDGAADNRAALAAYDSSLGTGEALILAPGTYLVNSNLTISHVVQFRPGAKIKPASGVAVGLSLGYFAGDYQQVFDLSAGGSITVAKTASGYVTPCQFGAAADGVADDTAEAKMAISAVGAPGRTGTGTVFFPRGTYKLSECLNLQDRITLYGETGTSYGRPLSVLRWPANCCGIICHAHNTTADSLGYNHALKTVEFPGGETRMALGSVIKHLTLLGNGVSTPAATAFDWATHGLRIKHGMVDVSNLYIAYWQGCGISIRGTSGVGESVLKEYEGGPNLMCLKDITIQDCAGHGIYVDGQDTNAGYFIGINSDGNRGWGIWDNSFLGNTYIACHVTGNTLGDYFAYDPNARNVFVGCYQEGGKGSHLQSPGVHLGGVSGIGLNGTAAEVGNFPGPSRVQIKNQSGLGKITITNAGSGYTSAPTVTFDAPSGAVQATATATIIGQHTFAGGIGVITVTNGGAGYSTVPNAVITGDGEGATLRVRMGSNPGAVGSITIIDANYVDRVGHDYTTANVVIDAPIETTATGTAYLTATGTLSHIHVTNRGSGYTTAPNITISGGGGSGAAATCILATAGGAGDDIQVFVNDAVNTDSTTRVLGFSRDDVSGSRWELMQESWSGDFFWRYAGGENGFRVTGPQTTRKFGRNETTPYATAFAKGVWLGGVSQVDNLRNLSGTTGVPGSGEYAKGDVLLYRDPVVSGNLGWVCTTTGTAGSTAVFQPFGAIGGIASLPTGATPSVANHASTLITTDTTTVTNFTNGVIGQRITILFEHAKTITDGTNIFLAGSANFVGASTDSLTLIQKADGKWYELSRSIN